MRGQRTVSLRQPKTGRVSRTRFDEESWEGVDRGLFEGLRDLRRTIADERSVPPFVIFSDATLRDLARVRPSSRAGLLCVRGIGERKLADLGDRFLAHVDGYCREKQLDRDVGISRLARRDRVRKRSDTKTMAFEMFTAGKSVDDVVAATARAPSTVWGYLEEYVETQRPASIGAWIDDATAQAVVDAIKDVGSAFLKPIFDHLGGRVPYERIRLMVAHLRPHQDGPRSQP
jgi:ATP-dependent DNA helicase RecQ